MLVADLNRLFLQTTYGSGTLADVVVAELFESEDQFGTVTQNLMLRAIDPTVRMMTVSGADDLGFTGVVDPQTTFNGVDVRRARINAPLAEVCKDQSFLKLFYNWERSHVFQLKLIEELEAVITENVRLLDLADVNTEVVEHGR
jgi:hypothetical protein